ncbi:MAG: 3-deoxy-7-phosphoheptulonate synthase [Planctomycetota bacterium]|jgi:3-deoxy-7-phosphoheptulonate synthase
MRVIMEESASLRQIGQVIRLIEDRDFRPFVVRQGTVTTVCVPTIRDEALFTEMKCVPGVGEVLPFSKPYRLVSREYNSYDTVVDVEGVAVGGKNIVLIAGPCAIESRNQLMEIAEKVALSGARILRGGAFKPRTSPYSFQGLKEEGLKLLREAGDRFGLRVVTEVVSAEDVELVAEYADILQIGSRNMQNFILLERLGKSVRPILLKRGMMCTMEEMLMSAEYIAAGGNPNIILCERGIRTFERYTRNTLDLSAVPVLKKLSHLPVIVDPSHACGNDAYVPPLALAGIAAGADGIMVEVHSCPGEALCDGKQSLTPAAFTKLVGRLTGIARAVNRDV